MKESYIFNTKLGPVVGDLLETVSFESVNCQNLDFFKLYIYERFFLLKLVFLNFSVYSYDINIARNLLMIL